MVFNYRFSFIKKKFANNKLLSDSFWAVLGNVIAKGLGLISGIFIAKFLGSNVYGEFGIIRNTLMASAIFSSFGLGYTATKYIAQYKDTNPHLIKLILKYCNLITLIASGILALILFTFAEYIATYILKASYLKIPLRLASLYIIFSASNTTQIGIISGFRCFKEMSKINSKIGVFTFIITIVFSYYFGLNGALISLVLSQVFNWYLNNILIKKISKNYLSDAIVNYDVLKEILVFSIPVALQEGVFAVFSFIINFLLISFSDFKEVGLYAAALQWFIVVLFIPGILRNVILSHLTEVSIKSNNYDKVLKTIMYYNLILTLLPFMLVYIFSGYLSAFYGESFNGIEDVINIVVFTAIFASLSNVYNQAYLSASKNWFIFIARFLRDFAIILSCYILFKLKVNIRGALILAWCSLFFNITYFFIISIYFSVKIKR